MKRLRFREGCVTSCQSHGQGGEICPLPASAPPLPRPSGFIHSTKNVNPDSRSDTGPHVQLESGGRPRPHPVVVSQLATKQEIARCSQSLGNDHLTRTKKQVGSGGDRTGASGMLGQPLPQAAAQPRLDVTDGARG
jgi:hypothetical protein